MARSHDGPPSVSPPPPPGPWVRRAPGHKLSAVAVNEVLPTARTPLSGNCPGPGLGSLIRRSAQIATVVRRHWPT
jgi:hypothetical protein